MNAALLSLLPRGVSRFWFVNLAVAIAVEALLFVGLLHFGAQGPSDTPSVGWTLYLTQMPGVALGPLVSRSFSEASRLGAVLHFVATFLIQTLVFFVLVSVARLFLGHDDDTPS